MDELAPPVVTAKPVRGREMQTTAIPTDIFDTMRVVSAKKTLKGENLAPELEKPRQGQTEYFHEGYVDGKLYLVPDSNLEAMKDIINFKMRPRRSTRYKHQTSYEISDYDHFKGKLGGLLKKMTEISGSTSTLSDEYEFSQQETSEISVEEESSEVPEEEEEEEDSETTSKTTSERTATQISKTLSEESEVSKQESILEPKPEPKPAPEQKPKSESVLERKAKPEPVPEQKPQPESVLEQKAKPEPVPDQKPKPESVLEQKAKPEPVPEQKPKPESVLERKAKPEPVPEQKPKPESVLEPKSKPKSVVERKGKPETVQEQKAKPESVPEQKPKPESVPEQKAKPDSVPERKHKPESVQEQKAKPESAPERKPKPEFVLQQKPKPESVLQQKPKSESELEQRPKPESVLVQKPKSESEFEKKPKPEPILVQKPKPEVYRKRFILSGHFKENQKPIFIIQEYDPKVNIFGNQKADYFLTKKDGNVDIKISGKFYKENVLVEDQGKPIALNIKPQKIVIDESRSKVYEKYFQTIFTMSTVDLILKGEFIHIKSTGKSTPFITLSVKRKESKDPTLKNREENIYGKKKETTILLFEPGNRNPFYSLKMSGENISDTDEPISENDENSQGDHIFSFEKEV